MSLARTGATVRSLRQPLTLPVGAWLLWEHHRGGPGTETGLDYWRIVRAWPQYEQCEAEREVQVAERAAKVAPGARVSDLLCLPDTVTDPRNRPEK